MVTKTTVQQANFEKYVLPEIDLLHRVAWSLTRSEIDAQDLVQDTLVRAFKAIDRFDGRYPRAWLLTILRNTNINRAKKKTPDLLKDPDLVFGKATNEDKTFSPEAMIDSSMDYDIQQAFLALPKPQQDVIDLVDLNGLSYQESADLLEVPIGTVMSRLHRGRKLIRTQLGDSLGRSAS